ncbi:MAG: monovalent cation/H+ antiporter subunit D [Pseudomonadota bacterium]|nr:monovalent cation/H+ antiporter subunit D [Pseudomonadota bacterium]
MMAFAIQHLAILPVAIALLAAALTLVVGERRLAQQRAIVWVAIGLMLLCGALAVNRTSGGQMFVYLMSNWRAPFGITLVVDKLAAIMLLLTAFIGAVVMAAQTRNGRPAGTYFYPLFMLQLMGLNGAFLTADLFNLFVFFEVLLAASYGMLLQHADRARTNAATQYVVINLLGSALFLIAAALLYGVTGTLNMADLSQKINAVGPQSRALVAAAGFLLLVVFAIKAALLPLNFWLTGTYRAAILPVAALFALMTKVGVVAIARTLTLIYPDGGVINAHMSQALLIIAPLTMLVAACGALSARDVSTLIGWSVVGSAGMLVTALAIGELKAISGALFYLIGSTLATALLFLNAASLDQAGARVAKHTDASGRRWASTGALFLIGGAVMAGLPPFSGFIGKATILAASTSHPAQVWVWTAVLLAGLLSILAYARMGSRLFWKRDAALVEGASLLPTGVLAIALVGLTVFAAPLQRFTDQAAAELKRPQIMIGNVLGKLPQQKLAAPVPGAGANK